MSKDKEYAEALSGPKNSLAYDTWRRLISNKAAVFGMAFMIFLILLAIFADFLFDYQTEVGRNLLARVVHGSRMSLAVSFSSVAMSLAGGGFLGAISGYYGGKVDNLIMRITDILLAIPMTLFAIVIVAARGANTRNRAFALAASTVPIFARVVRGAVITVRDVEFVEAARAIGATNRTIICSHIIPNCLSPIIVQVTLRIASAIYNTAALSFLGMGVQAPAPEWGGLLAGGRTYIRDYSYLSIIPGIAIMLTVLALNLLGDGLRDALDPRLK